MARAFQSIACDEGFIEAVGTSVNDDLEFSLAYFFMNNPAYETLIQDWLSQNNYSINEVMLTSVPETPWIYAANYGVHEVEETPTLALAIDLDSTILDEKSDFIPCYYSLNGCNEYQVGLIGLEDDLGPEDPSLPTRNLVLIFSGQIEESFNKKERLNYGSSNQYLGTVIDPGTGNGNCEFADTYIANSAYLTQSFNRSKKIKLSSRFRWDSDCDDGWGVSWGGNNPKKITQGNKSTMLNSVLSFNYYLEYSQSLSGQLLFSQAVGAVYERDWYAKSYIKMYAEPEPGWCTIGYTVELPIKSKRNTEVYALYYIRGDWCLGEIREFNVPSNRPGDHSSYFRVKASVY